MKTPAPTSFSRLLAGTALAAFAAGVGAQSPEPELAAAGPRSTPVGSFLAPIHTAADDPVGGCYGTWAAGPDYKVSFGREVEFFPVLGATAPRNLPFGWRTVSVRHGQVALVDGDAAVDSTPVHDASLWHDGGYRFEIRHGLVTEAYDVRHDGVEQSFVVHERIGSGDLVVIGAVRTELAAVERGPVHAPLDFDADGEPTVRYGSAFAIDATGARTPMTTSFENGRIELRLAANWLAEATWPITVDPLLTTRRVSAAAGHVRGVDVARDDVANQLLTVVSRLSSGNDTDGFAFVTDDGFSTPRMVWSDVTSSWQTNKPTAAFVGGPRRWIIAFERRFAQVSRIRAHLRDSGDLTLSTAYISLTAPTGVTATRPDVGGTTGFAPGDHALVAYRSDVSTNHQNTNHSEEWGVRVDARNSQFLAPFLLSNVPVGTRYDRGGVDVSQVSDDGWLVTYEERDRGAAIPNPDVMIARVRPDGSLAGSGFLASRLVNEVHPRVAGRDGRYLVTFGVVHGDTTRAWPAVPEIAGRRVDWPLSARLPNYGPIRTVLGRQSSLTTYVNASLAYDDVSRSYWQMATISINYAVETHRIGYDVRVTERTRFLTIGTNTAVTYNDDASEFAVVHSDNASVHNLWGSRIGPPPGSATTYGAGCGPARIESRNPGLLGSEFFTVVLRLAMPSQPAFLFVAPSAGSQPLDPIGMTGCTLLLSTTALSLSATTDSTGRAELRFPIPGIISISELRFQWVHFAPGANALGLRTTAGLDIRPR